jgi:predicted nucleic acid-binding protein
VTAAFFDTSALVKLLLEEPGAAAARQAWEMADPQICSRLAFVEARAALAAAHRAGRLDAGQLVVLKRRFAEMTVQAAVVDVDEALVDVAADLAEKHALRGYDAVHLAAALAAATPLFVSADADQLRAAHAENLAILDPAAATA